MCTRVRGFPACDGVTAVVVVVVGGGVGVVGVVVVAAAVAATAAVAAAAAQLLTKTFFCGPGARHLCTVPYSHLLLPCTTPMVEERRSSWFCFCFFSYHTVIVFLLIICRAFIFSHLVTK